MNQKELEKLQQAQSLIKERKFQQALAILKTMPNNAKAREWAGKIEEKLNSGTKPTPPQKTPQTPVSKPKKNTSRRMLLFAVAVIVVIAVAVVGMGVVNNNASYNAYLPRARAVLGAFCAVTWTERSIEECAVYARDYLEQDRNMLYRVQICETWWNDGDLRMFTTCLRDIQVPVEILGY